jgi:hypothetical protein
MMAILATLLLAAQAATPTLSSSVCIATTVVAQGERPGRGTPTFSAARTPGAMPSSTSPIPTIRSLRIGSPSSSMKLWGPGH